MKRKRFTIETLNTIKDPTACVLNNTIFAEDINAIQSETNGTILKHNVNKRLKTSELLLVNRKINFLENLPSELICHILTFLEINSLLNFALMCKTAYSFIFEKEKFSKNNYPRNYLYKNFFITPFHSYIKKGDFSKAYLFIKNNESLVGNYELLLKQYSHFIEALKSSECFINKCVEFVNSKGNIKNTHQKALLQKLFLALKGESIEENTQAVRNCLIFHAIAIFKHLLALNETNKQTSWFVFYVIYSMLNLPFALAVEEYISHALFLCSFRNKNFESLLIFNPLGVICILNKLIANYETLLSVNSADKLSGLKNNICLSIAGLFYKYGKFIETIDEKAKHRVFYLTVFKGLQKHFSFYTEEDRLIVSQHLNNILILLNKSELNCLIGKINKAIDAQKIQQPAIKALVTTNTDEIPSIGEASALPKTTSNSTEATGLQ